MKDVKCIDCKHANWQLTPKGFIKKNIPGRCEADMPEYPKALCMPEHFKPKVHKAAIWTDHIGECEFYEAKP